MLDVQRSTVVRCLLAHDEEELGERVPSVTGDELMRIGERADYYLLSGEDVYPTAAFGTTTAVSLAAVDVLEGASRELRRWDCERDPGG